MLYACENSTLPEEVDVTGSDKKRYGNRRLMYMCLFIYNNLSASEASFSQWGAIQIQLPVIRVWC